MHDPAEPNFVKELGFGVLPGKQTLVSIQEQRITFLPPPWGVCDSGSDKNDYRFFDDYSTSACLVSCQTEYITDACGCRMVHQPKLATLTGGVENKPLDDFIHYMNVPYLSVFPAKSDNYGTYPEIGQLTIGHLRYIYYTVAGPNNEALYF